MDAFTKILQIVLLTLICAIEIKGTKYVPLCLNIFKRVCYPCLDNRYNISHCSPINPDMRVVHYNFKTLVDYSQYLDTNVQIIEELDRKTFYSCPFRDDYFQVNTTNFYPIGRPLTFSKQAVGKRTAHSDSKFQLCLETYCCLKNDNRFTCYDTSFGGLDFAFNNIVTLKCLQNITSVHLWSNNITKITVNRFFLNAHNIVNMVLDFERLNAIQCNAFQNLRSLRMLEFDVNSEQSHFLKYDCIFHFNPNLVKINLNGEWIWKMCTADIILIDSNYDVFIVIGFATLFFLIILLITLQYRNHFFHCLNSNSRIVVDNLEMDPRDSRIFLV